MSMNILSNFFCEAPIKWALNGIETHFFRVVKNEIFSRTS